MAATAAAYLLSIGPAASAVSAATPIAVAPAVPAAAPVADPSAVPGATPIAAAPAVDASTPAGSSAPAATPIAAAPIVASVRATTPLKAVPTRADQVIAIARSKLGRPWVYGAAGPSLFDCSGLVIYAFRTAGISSVVGSSSEVSAYALYARFRALGRASRTGGRPGDLVIWGGGSHVGIYLGNGLAISTLVSGVRVHAIGALTTPFTAFLHTGIAAIAATAVPRPSPTRATAARVAVTSHRIVTTAVRLRSGASTAASVIDTLAAGTNVGVVGSARDGSGRSWVHVLVGGRLGWVAGWLTRAA
jgi:cell wall-associated NlpC family hydrolase